jgi:hypothetical protein
VEIEEKKGKRRRKGEKERGEGKREGLKKKDAAHFLSLVLHKKRNPVYMYTGIQATCGSSMRWVEPDPAGF